MEDTEFTARRFKELAEKCYQDGQYTFTGFLSLAEVSCFYQIEKEVNYVPYTIWGGSEMCERVLIRFGSEEQLGYTENFPITCLKAEPIMAKYADALTHRDFLGAIMNLGIERSVIGDIFILDNVGYIFCMNKMSSYLQENLGNIKHTSVLCSEVKELPVFQEGEKQKIVVQVNSERIDGILAKVYRLSRSDAILLFEQKKVYIDGRVCENNSRNLKPSEKISVRGYGKFEYLGNSGLSKKGKTNVQILVYGKANK